MLSIFGFVRRNLVMITRKEFTEQVEKLLVGSKEDEIEKARAVRMK